MPIYEYECKEDGRVIELLRPIAKADDPVVDPEGKGGTFVRKHSVFASANAGGATAARGSGGSAGGGCCPCGKNAGGCGSRE